MRGEMKSSMIYLPSLPGQLIFYCTPEEETLFELYLCFSIGNVGIASLETVGRGMDIGYDFHCFYCYN